jgi:uncharacterized protein Smg (DUF494 family)
MKNMAIEKLSSKYESSNANKDDIKQLLYSIGDYNSYLNSTMSPLDKMIDYLKTYFSPKKVEKYFSLQIYSGENGARLSHDHERQYNYVLQSLLLWRY